MNWDLFFKIPEGQGFLYAYQPLIAAALALLGALLIYSATRYSANIHAKRVTRALLDYCINLDSELRGELEYENRNTRNKKIDRNYLIHLGRRLQRFQPSLMTNENLIVLKGVDLLMASRVKGLLEYLYIIIDRDSNDSAHLESNHEWFDSQYKHYRKVLEQILSQTEWFVGAHTGMINRIRYKLENPED